MQAHAGNVVPIAVSVELNRAARGHLHEILATTFDPAIIYCMDFRAIEVQPLQRLVDRTGVKFLGEGEWKRKKHGAEYRREWLACLQKNKTGPCGTC